MGQIENPTDAFGDRWLAAVQAARNLSPDGKRVARWLAANLQSGTTVHKTWQQMKNELRLPNFGAGLHLTALTTAGFVGERIRTGPGAGFPLEMPLPKPAAERTVSSYETRAEVEARNARRAAARRAADLLADKRWQASK